MHVMTYYVLKACTCSRAIASGPMAVHPIHHSLNIASGFSLEGSCLRNGDFLHAAATVDSRVEASQYALSGENLQFLRGERKAYGSVRNAAECLKKKAHTFANPNATPFPDAVVYPQHCPHGFCIGCASPREKQFLADMLAMFAKCSASFGKPPQVAQADIILGLFLHHDRDAAPDKVIFASLPAVSARAAHHPATQTFASWTPSSVCATRAECVGVRLTLDCGEFERPGKKVRSPVDQQCCGPASMMTEHEIVKMISTCFVPPGEIEISALPSVDQVIAHKMVYRDVSLSEVVITGWDDAFDVAPVQAITVLQPAAKRPKPEPAADGLDFLSLLKQPRAPSRGQDRGSGRGPCQEAGVAAEAAGSDALAGEAKAQPL